MDPLRTVKRDGPRSMPVEVRIWDAAGPVSVAAGGACRQSVESVTLTLLERVVGLE